jgi:hypothetical protein
VISAGWIDVKTTDPMGSAPEDVPEEVVAQAKAAFARRTKGETAVLVWDSLVDENAPLWDHRLRFEHREVQFEVRILGANGSSTIEGQVHPLSGAAIALESDDGRVLGTVEVTDGAFALERVSPGVVRLCLQGPDPTVPVCTDWFRI